MRILFIIFALLTVHSPLHAQDTSFTWKAIGLNKNHKLSFQSGKPVEFKLYLAAPGVTQALPNILSDGKPVYEEPSAKRFALEAVCGRKLKCTGWNIIDATIYFLPRENSSTAAEFKIAPTQLSPNPAENYVLIQVQTEGYITQSLFIPIEEENAEGMP